MTLACRFAEAAALLNALDPPEDPLLQARIAFARAEAAHRSSYVRRTDDAGTVDRHLAAAAALLGSRQDEALAWDVERLRVQHHYATALRHEDGSPWFGPVGRDAADVQRLVDDADALLATALDDRRAGWAQMLVGWISDNIVGDRAGAPRHYLAGLAAGRAADDLVLVFEAQRHLGDHAHDEGDHDDALVRWQDSAAAAARGGHVSGVLAQQVLLAVLARDAGDEAGARGLAAEVARWAASIGATSLVAQADTVLAGLDPTRPPAGR